MKNYSIINSVLLVALMFTCCENEQGETDFSGVYCLNLQSLEMTIIQNGQDVTFSLQTDLLTNGTGTISGDSLILSAYITASVCVR
jgi:hypothetical protein